MIHRLLVICACAAATAALTTTVVHGAPTGSAMVLAPHAQATSLHAVGKDDNPQWVGPKGSATNVLYVTDSNAGIVRAYADDGLHRYQIGTLSGLGYPYGVYVDNQSNIWICSWTGKVFEFQRGTHQLLRRLTGLQRPLYVVVDKNGAAYVGQADIGQVAVFQPNSSTPKILQIPGSEADGLDLDRAGNLFVAYRSRQSGGIVEFPAGSTQAVDLGIHIDQPQGLAVDRYGNIIVAESRRNLVDVFPAGATLPSQQIRYFVPTEIALDDVQGRISVSELSLGVARTRYPFDPQAPRLTLRSRAVQGATFNHDL